LDLKNARDRLQRYRQKLERDDAALLIGGRRHMTWSKQKKGLGDFALKKKHKQVLLHGL
jgi:hypothetical protein